MNGRSLVKLGFPTLFLLVLCTSEIFQNKKNRKITPLSACLASFYHDLPFLEDNVCLKNGAAEMTPASAFTLSGHPTGSLPASNLPLDPDLTPDLLQLLALICSHLTPCAPKWMCQEILQTLRSNSASLLTSTSAVLHLSGLNAWQDTWERKFILQRPPTEDLPSQERPSEQESSFGCKNRCFLLPYGTETHLGNTRCLLPPPPRKIH